MNPQAARIWAFDFDGTISNLVPDRASATLDPECRNVLLELADDPTQVVAIVSSRSLEDLCLRVTLERVVLIGGCGMEWRLRSGRRLHPNRRATRRLEITRRHWWPDLEALQGIPGVELEDKAWSAAVHFRNVSARDRIALSRQLHELRVRHQATLQFGPEVAEIQFFPEVSKQRAARSLVALFAPQEKGRNLFFAGDDEADARALRWVLDRKGTAYVVGKRITVPGASVVTHPAALALALRHRLQSGGAQSEAQEEAVAHE